VVPEKEMLIEKKNNMICKCAYTTWDKVRRKISHLWPLLYVNETLVYASMMFCKFWQNEFVVIATNVDT
jgi:hypothetical protein